MGKDAETGPKLYNTYDEYLRAFVDGPGRAVAPTALTLMGATCAALAVALVALGGGGCTLVAMPLFAFYIWFDDLDGPVARRYGRTSRGGHILDQTVDVAVSLSLLAALAVRYPAKLWDILAIYFIGYYGLMMVPYYKWDEGSACVFTFLRFAVLAFAAGYVRLRTGALLGGLGRGGGVT